MTNESAAWLLKRVQQAYAQALTAEQQVIWLERLLTWDVDDKAVRAGFARMVETERYPTLAALKASMDSAAPPKSKLPYHQPFPEFAELDGQVKQIVGDVAKASAMPKRRKLEMPATQHELMRPDERSVAQQKADEDAGRERIRRQREQLRERGDL